MRWSKESRRCGPLAHIYRAFSLSALGDRTVAIISVGTDSANDPAMAFTVLSSPTPKVVTTAEMPLIRAYPSAA